MNGDGVFGPLDVDVIFRVIYPLIAASVFGALFNLYSFPIPDADVFIMKDMITPGCCICVVLFILCIGSLRSCLVRGNLEFYVCILSRTSRLIQGFKFW